MDLLEVLSNCPADCSTIHATGNHVGLLYQPGQILLPNLKVIFNPPRHRGYTDSPYDYDIQGLPYDIGDGLVRGNNRVLPWLLTAVDDAIRNEDMLYRPFSTSLVYLDISGSRRMKRAHIDFLQHGDLPSLRVLKMRNLQLNNTELGGILKKIGAQLSCLDVRGNVLTDMIQYAGLSPSAAHAAGRIELEHGQEVACISEGFDPNKHTVCYLYEPRPPPYELIEEERETHFFTQLDGRSFIPDEEDSIVRFLFRYWYRLEKATRDGSQPEHDTPFQTALTGINTLYLSGNHLTAKALENMLLDGLLSLCLLDIGSVGEFDAQSRVPESGMKYHLECQALCLPKLNALSIPRVEVLRVHHSIVTLSPTVNSNGGRFISDHSLALLADRWALYKHNLKPWEPDMMPRLHTLTLTSMPRKATRTFMSYLLTLLKKAALQEAAIAKVTSTNRHAPKMVSGLRILRLEFLPFDYDKPFELGGSISEDPDADEFYTQSSMDFSFFPDEDAQHGPDISDVVRNLKGNATEVVDVIEELKRYRSETAYALSKEKERLEGLFPEEDAWSVVVPPGLPHCHWGGKLEIVHDVKK